MICVDVGSWREGGGRPSLQSEATDAGPGTINAPSDHPQGTAPPESARAGGPGATMHGMRPGMPGIHPHMGGMMPHHFRAMMPAYVRVHIGYAIYIYIYI